MNDQELEFVTFMWSSAYVYRCCLKRMNGEQLTKNERALGLVQSIVLLSKLNNMPNDVSFNFASEFMRTLKKDKINTSHHLEA